MALHIGVCYKMTQRLSDISANSSTFQYEVLYSIDTPGWTSLSRYLSLYVSAKPEADDKLITVYPDTFPSLVIGGLVTTAWEYVRKTNNYNSRSPVRTIDFIQLHALR